MLRIAALLAIFLLGFTSNSQAQKLYDDERTPEGWAWKQIRNDQIADFQARCGHLDPHTKNGWEDPCRQISPKFLVEMLTVQKWRDQVPRRRARLLAVRIDATIDLSDSEILLEAWIDASRIEGDLILSDTHWNRPFSLRGSNLAGKFLAERMRSESLVSLRDHAAVEGEISLVNAKINGNLEMANSSFSKGVNTNSLSVSGSVFLSNRATFGGELNLANAKINGNLEMDSSSFDKAITGDALTVGGLLSMRDHATFRGDLKLAGAKIGGDIDMETSSFTAAFLGNHFSVTGGLFMRRHATLHGPIDLVEAKIGGPVEMSNSSFGNEVNLNGANVGGSLEMNNSSFGKGVNLSLAKVSGNLEMINSLFTGLVTAESLVEGNLFMSDATFARAVSLIGAKVHGVLDLRRAVATRADLSGAVAGEFLLGGLGWWCTGGETAAGPAAGQSRASDKTAATHWPLGDPAWRNTDCEGKSAPPMLILRNTHVDAFQDSPDAWPPSVDLEGFRYERLGSVLLPIGNEDMRQRSSEAWIDWIERNRTFSTQPYVQLAATLLVAGRRSTAETIQLAGRERERSETWTHNDYYSWAWLTMLSYVAGYGIGLYTFMVLWWVGGLSILGALILLFSSNARPRWCSPNATLGLLCLVGASLHRLLPIVKLSKEFEDFFDNPMENPRNLARWQVIYFAMHAILGWFLGLILLAAMAGLTQKG
jgi:hypothetical protein